MNGFDILAVAMILAMLAAAALHALWALRVWWPIRDEARLAQAVVGTQGLTRMPGSAITWAVVVLIAAGVLLVAALAGWIALPLPGWALRLAGWGMAAVLLLRGAGAYVARGFGMRWEMPFHRLDALAYSPIILALGLGTLILLLQ